MAKSATSINQVKNEATDNARKAAGNPWTKRLIRLGYIARGLVYLIPGILALQLAMGTGGGVVNQTGAIEYIGRQPYGNILLVIEAIGLLGYSLWGLIRAAFDPFHEGDDAEGLLKRFGYIVSALGYSALLLATVQYLQGAVVSSAGSNPQDWTAKLLEQPWGRIVVGIIGLGWIIGGGIRQIYDGYKANFRKDLTLSQMRPFERKWAVGISRFGVIARGVVFALIGLFLVQAAVLRNPGAAKGLDGALLELATKPYGTVLVAIVALGLIAFGLYSFLCARWMRIRLPRASSK